MKSYTKQVVTRFAPSPTGLLHLGAYRTAIFAYLYAKKHHGKFILRIEDTDKGRSKKEYENNILESLEWLSLKYDEFYRQSENLPNHKKYLEKLIANGHAYISKEEARDPLTKLGTGIVRDLIRFKNPNIDVSFHDEIKGTVTMNTTDLGDFVIAKNMNEPLFHLAVVADDFDEGVTHVIRGEDHISNTPRQILIGRAIGAPTPVYAHLPLVLGPDKLKLSKRRGALPVTSYHDEGYLPEAILNGVAFIGWHPSTALGASPGEIEQEIFSFDELVKKFDLKKVQKSPAIFNKTKLEWFNKEHMRRLPTNILEHEVGKRISNFPCLPAGRQFSISNKMLKKLTPVILERINKWSDIDEMIRVGELTYFFERPVINKSEMVWKKLRDEPNGGDLTKQYLTCVVNLLKILEDFNAETVKKAIWQFVEEKGKGEVLWPMRYSLTGLLKSPDPFILAGILGKVETIERIQNAIK